MNDVGKAVSSHLASLGVRHEDIKYAWVTFRKVEKAAGGEQTEEYKGHVEFKALPDDTSLMTHFALHYTVKDMGPVYIETLVTDERSAGVLRDTHYHREICEELLDNELLVVARFMALWWNQNYWRFPKDNGR